MKKLLIPVFAFILGYFSNQTTEKIVSYQTIPSTIESPSLVGMPSVTPSPLESTIINLKEEKSRLETQIEEYEFLLNIYPNFQPFNFVIPVPYGNSITQRYNNNPLYFTTPNSINELIQLLVDIKDGYINPTNLYRTKITRKNNTYTLVYDGHPYEEPPFTNGFKITLTLTPNTIQIYTTPKLEKSPTIYFFSDYRTSIYSIGGVKVNYQPPSINFRLLEYLVK